MSDPSKKKETFEENYDDEDDDDEETRLRDRLLARRAKQLQDLIAAEPSDNAATATKKHHHHKKKKRRHDSDDEEIDPTTRPSERLVSVASAVSSVVQQSEIMEEEGLTIKPPQASDQKRHKKGKTSQSEERSPDYQRREDNYSRYHKQRQDFYDSDRRRHDKAEEGWASWKKSLDRPSNYGRGAVASSVHRPVEQGRGRSSPRSDRHGSRKDGPSPPPSKWSSYKYGVDHGRPNVGRAQAGRERRKDNERSQSSISSVSQSSKHSRLGKESVEGKPKIAPPPLPNAVELVSPEATPTMDEHDDFEAKDEKADAKKTGEKKTRRQSVGDSENRDAKRLSPVSGSSYSRKSSRSSMESGEHRSDDERDAGKDDHNEGVVETKKSKYSKFESSSSESSEEGDSEQEDYKQGQSGESDVQIDEEQNEKHDDTPATEPKPGLDSELNVSPAPEFDVESTLPVYFPALMGCRSVEEFQSLNRIEEGTYGVVYRAKEKRTDEIVALKRLKMEKEKEGFPITSLREINMLLKAGKHPNIVKVREIVVGSNMDKIYLVMDYVEHDLKSLLETMRQPFLIGEAKTLLKQLLSGVKHLHENWILHRDLKTSNLLLSHKGILKIADFGLAREYGSPLKPYTPIVVTLWYRAPELLLGIKEYSTPIDVWSVGCIFAEILTLKPFFTGKSEIEQLNRIFKVLGTPNDTIWPGYGELPGVKRVQFADVKYNYLRKNFGATLSDKGFGLMNRFLTYDPVRRISAAEALEEEWFKEEPRPVRPDLFPTWPAKSEQSKAPKKGPASPKAPSGGKQFFQNESDKDYLAGLKGRSGAAAVPGFSLKFDAPKF